MSRAVPVGPVAGVAGLLGTLACVGAMGLAVLGIAGVGASASAAGMADMAATGALGTAATVSPAGLLGLLLRVGPAILVVSIGAVALSLGIRRRAAAIPALLGGGMLYWGMYAQPNLALMGAAIVAGLLLWVAAEIWARASRRPQAQGVSP